LTGEECLETLEIATANVAQNEKEAKAWQAALLRKTADVPFPVAYESNLSRPAKLCVWKACIARVLDGSSFNNHLG